MKLPKLRKNLPKLLAEELVGVQPMSIPSGSSVFKMKYRYEDYSFSDMCRDNMTEEDLDKVVRYFCDVMEDPLLLSTTVEHAIQFFRKKEHPEDIWDLIETAYSIYKL